MNVCIFLFSIVYNKLNDSSRVQVKSLSRQLHLKVISFYHHPPQSLSLLLLMMLRSHNQ